MSSSVTLQTTNTPPSQIQKKLCFVAYKKSQNICIHLLNFALTRDIHEVN